MSATPKPQVIPLRRDVSDGSAPRLVEAAPRVDTAALHARAKRQLTVVMPVINLVAVALTYVFVTYVLPLPGSAGPIRHQPTAIISTLLLTALGWAACQIWAMHTLRPLRAWLLAGGAPDELQRARAIRFPLIEAWVIFVVWSFAGLASASFDVAIGGSVGAGAIDLVVVVLGGLVASSMGYLAAEQIMRPAVALALESDPPDRPLLPGIGARIYLAWEFGTAVAVIGCVVVAIAYLSGAAIAPRRMAGTVIFLGALVLTVGLGTLLVAIRSIVVPLRSLRRAVAAVEAGETDVTVTVDDGGEIGLLQAGFNRMVAGLRERDRVRDLFGRHVGRDVARSALAREIELGGELRQAAVLFVDVIGSTAFVSRSDPREVVDTLNRFFAIVVQVVTIHGGWVNKFEGDAALCVFGAPTTHPDAPGAALVAARELTRRLRYELDGVHAAIGLSCGQVVAGNIGAADRYEYTVIGDPVNEAARLTELAKSSSSRVLASDAIVAAAPPAEAARWKLGEPVVLRGRPTPTRVAVPA